ncbi:MAG: hypothetical protein KC431_18190 [Myxococcales bacterium]|nr:hypothetical protein [Myxococcales bacterium]
MLLLSGSAACGAASNGEQAPRASEASQASQAGGEGASPQPAEAPRLRRLVIDDSGGCVIVDDEHISCWGRAPESAEPLRAHTVALGPTNAAIVDMDLANEVLFVAFADGQLRVLPRQGQPRVESLPPGTTQIRAGGFHDQALHCARAGTTVQCSPGPTLTGVVDFAVGDRDGCVLHNDGKLSCWQPGQAPVNPTPAAQWSPEPVGKLVEVAMGGPICARDQDGVLWCSRAWSSPIYGGIDKLWLVPVSGDAKVVDFDVSLTHYCWTRQDGALWCGGNNGLAQLGARDSELHRDPVEVPLPGPARELALSATQSCALVDHQVWCWGTPVAASPSRRTVSFELEAVRLLADEHLSCAFSTGGELRCWGSEGWLGLDEHGGIVAAASPQPAYAVREPVDDYAGGAVLARGQLYTGRVFAVLGGDSEVVHWKTSGVASFASNRSELCLIRRAGALECFEQAIQDDSMVRLAGVPALSGASSVAMDLTDVCAVVAGHVQCLNFPDQGASRWRALPGVEATVVVRYGLGYCALSPTGTATCWTADADAEDYAISDGPSNVGEDIVEIDGGDRMMCVRTRGGSVRCATGIQNHPIEMATVVEQGALEIAVGEAHVCARIDTDEDGVSEQILCHGENPYGELGALADLVMLEPTRIEGIR